MTATVHVLPIVPRVHPQDPDWNEQRQRELWARTYDEMAAPPRTRPLIVSHRPGGDVGYEK